MCKVPDRHCQCPFSSKIDLYYILLLFQFSILYACISKLFLFLPLYQKALSLQGYKQTLAEAHRIDSDVPWPDIRYIFGEIMYGGHITDQWDRRVCNTYLLTLVMPELLSNMSLAPGFKSPDASKMEYSSYQKLLGLK